MNLQARQRGFTLVEVLVAVLILGLVLGAVISAMGQFARQTAYIRDKTIALWVAHNQLTELRLSSYTSWPAVGQTKDKVEMAERKWTWVQKVTATDDDNLRRVDLSVYAGEGMDQSKNAYATLSGFVSNKSSNGSTTTTTN